MSCCETCFYKETDGDGVFCDWLVEHMSEHRENCDFRKPENIQSEVSNE